MDKLLLNKYILGDSIMSNIGEKVVFCSYNDQGQDFKAILAEFIKKTDFIKKQIVVKQEAKKDV